MKDERIEPHEDDGLVLAPEDRSLADAIARAEREGVAIFRSTRKRLDVMRTHRGSKTG